MRSLFFSGMILPLVVFPGWLGEVARALPWAAMLQVPADVWLGRHPAWSLVGAGFQPGWAWCCWSPGGCSTSPATRKVVVQGG